MQSANFASKSQKTLPQSDAKKQRRYLGAIWYAKKGPSYETTNNKTMTVKILNKASMMTEIWQAKILLVRSTLFVFDTASVPVVVYILEAHLYLLDPSRSSTYIHETLKIADV